MLSEYDGTVDGTPKLTVFTTGRIASAILRQYYTTIMLSEVEQSL